MKYKKGLSFACCTKSTNLSKLQMNTLTYIQVIIQTVFSIERVMVTGSSDLNKNIDGTHIEISQAFKRNHILKTRFSQSTTKCLS